MVKKNILKLSGLFTSPVYADALGDRISQGLTEASTFQCSSGSGTSCLSSYVNTIITFAVPVGVLVAVGLMIGAGYTMITSQGNPEKLAQAKESISNAITGFALLALSVAILLLIRNTLNIPGI